MIGASGTASRKTGHRVRQTPLYVTQAGEIQVELLKGMQCICSIRDTICVDGELVATTRLYEGVHGTTAAGQYCDTAGTSSTIFG